LCSCRCHIFLCLLQTLQDLAAAAAKPTPAPVEGVLKPPVEPPPAKRARLAMRQPVPLNLLKSTASCPKCSEMTRQRILPEERCWVFRAHGALPGWVGAVPKNCGPWPLCTLHTLSVPLTRP
jgi:hypothetical protein